MNKIDNIKILLELNGSLGSYEKSALDIIDAVKHLIPNFEINEDFNPSILKDIIEDIQNQLIPIYDKYFTDEEILGIIEFYKTPIGQVYLKKMGKVSLECMELGNKYGEMVYNKLVEYSNMKDREQNN